MRVLCLYTPNSKKGQYAVIYDWQRWPERTLQHRGWLNGERVFDRPGTDAETLQAKNSMRFLAWHYSSWDGVVRDDALYGIDADVCRCLRDVDDLALVQTRHHAC